MTLHFTHNDRDNTPDSMECADMDNVLDHMAHMEYEGYGYATHLITDTGERIDREALDALDLERIRDSRCTAAAQAGQRGGTA